MNANSNESTSNSSSESNSNSNSSSSSSSSSLPPSSVPLPSHHPHGQHHRAWGRGAARGAHLLHVSLSRVPCPSQRPSCLSSSSSCDGMPAQPRAPPRRLAAAGQSRLPRRRTREVPSSRDDHATVTMSAMHVIDCNELYLSRCPAVHDGKGVGRAKLFLLSSVQWSRTRSRRSP